MLDDLGARVALAAAVEDAALGQPADGIFPRRPPLRSLASGLVELENAVGLCPAEVQRNPPSRNDRPHSVGYLSACFVLVESKVQPSAQEVSRLRDAARDAPANRGLRALSFADREGVRHPEIVPRFELEERFDI